MMNTKCIIAVSSSLMLLLCGVSAHAQQPAPAPANTSYDPVTGYPTPTPAPTYSGAPGEAYPAYPPPATTNYHVVYPQRRGALPPGMELPYYEGQPIPPGYRLVTRPRKGLVLGGLLTMGIPWALSVSIASGNDFEDGSGWLIVPGLGPWLMLAAGGANNHCATTDYYCEDTDGALRGILVLDGLVQTAGLVMLASGLYFPTKRLVRGDVTVSMLPSRVGTDGYGVGLAGTF